MPATGCPYPKLEPHTWRNLLARATIFHAIRDQLGDLSDRALAVDAIDIAMRKINVHADEVSAAQPDACLAVVQTATAWIADLSEAARLRSIEADDAALLNRVVAQLAEVVTPASTAAPHPFAEVFTKVERRSASAYTKPHWRRPTLTLAKDSDHPRAHHFQRDPYAVSATTSPDGVVQLVLWPAGFSPATYAVLSSILVHECICHVPARQDRVDNDSIFAEGLMDWAAAFFHNRWLTSLDHRLAPMARLHAKTLREVFSPPARRTAELRAEELIGWFTQPSVGRPIPALAAPFKVANLALSLNTTPGCLDCKDRFVSRLRRPFSRDLAGRIGAWGEGRLPPAELLQCTCTKTQDELQCSSTRTAANAS